ncbi:MAG: hypothetical protein CVU94_02755 [Firmicutes bacterium HGW-Firmicutes-19]|jgi:amidase|nr:MAG: hypothetical protein CVU94_02755 [Firmicutes bacterium HGW-Firmicutes-19]
MEKLKLLDLPRLTVSDQPPYDPLQAFVRDNHIALEGSKSGPLNGLVYAAKDVFMIKGSTFGNGHPDWLKTHEPDPYTASAVLKLLDAGADLVGKTVCDELCFSISGENWNYGSPFNPHDIRRYTGGSSAGSGSATAGGLVDFAIGSDCLGSVRVPAAYNGLLGMRPSYKRISNDGEAPYCASMDVLGYVASEPDVFKKVSEVLLGNDLEDVEFKKLYIADDCFEALDLDVFEALKVAVDFVGSKLDSIHHVRVAPEGLNVWIEAFRIVQGYEVWESYGGWIQKYRPRLSRGPKERLEWSSTITRNQYKDALSEKQRIANDFKEFLPKDAILCLPTTATVAPLRTTSLEEINRTRAISTNFLCISPMTETPQVTVPLVKQHDVPLSLTLISTRGTDLALAKFASKLVNDYRKQKD